MFERYTARSRQAIVAAQEEARTFKHSYIGTEHLLLGILRIEDGAGCKVLNSLGVSLEDVRSWVTETVDAGIYAVPGQIPFTPGAKKALEFSLREALSLGHNYIGTEHVLLGLVRETDGNHARYFATVDITQQQVRDAIIMELSGPHPKRHAEPLARAQRLAKQIRRDLETLEQILEQI